jgi:hypothetical protein
MPELHPVIGKHDLTSCQQHNLKANSDNSNASTMMFCF